MYDKRIKIFIGLCVILLLTCLARLIPMQLFPGSSVQDEIATLRAQGQQSKQLKTIRGKILDRKGRVLATDEPEFHLCINYELCSILDDRIRMGMLLKAETKKVRPNMPPPVEKTQEEIESKLDDIEQVFEKCEIFGVQREELEQKVRNINNSIWNTRSFIAWWTNHPNHELEKQYGSIGGIKVEVAMRDFVESEPNEAKRILMTMDVDIPKMHKDYRLLELETDDAVFSAQLIFMETEGVRIEAGGRRIYPYGTAACQTLGWVGPATQESDKLNLDPNDKLSSYLPGEVCGREDGVEYVCEAILRGRRGEEVYDIDRQLVRETETEFGEDVQLTLDIELQGKIEDFLTNYKYNEGAGPGVSTVVIDVETNDILALVSVPVYNPNNIREQYIELSEDTNKPRLNRAINNWYPPGSVVKPLILIAGMETGKVTADKIIGCPAKAAPRRWPNCWYYKTTGWAGHDNLWDNNARNAIKGSCNIYFSHLADMIDREALQQWLFAFGYGRCLIYPPEAVANMDNPRNFRELPGMISSKTPDRNTRFFEQISPLDDGEKRWFGIGQGKMLATPLQVANSMAVIARGGIFRLPNLFLKNGEEVTNDHTDLGINPHTMSVVLDGMSAVVNENQGTANKIFAPALSLFKQEELAIRGKTGSTEPANAWFAGFARDSEDRCIALAIVVEGGESGSHDAAPLARDIIQLCVEAGYVGKLVVTNTSEQ